MLNRKRLFLIREKNGLRYETFAYVLRHGRAICQMVRALSTPRVVVYSSTNSAIPGILYACHWAAP